jgi:hypothetical protein
VNTSRILKFVIRATQFVSNTSQDPLVIGPTETDSDLRIFNADGGALIKELANSNDRFISNCNSLLERMINTVPKGVTLSEPITPIAVKPQNIALFLNDDGETLQFSGGIRVSLKLLIYASDLIVA